MSYPDDRYEGILPAPPPPPRISSAMENDGTAGAGNHFTHNNDNSSTSVYRDDNFKSRTMDRDRRERSSHRSGFMSDSRGYDSRDGRTARDSRDNREIRDYRDSRGEHKDVRDGNKRYNRERDDRSSRRHRSRSRSRSRSPYKRHKRYNDYEYSKNRRRRSRSNSRDRRNRRRSRSSSGGDTNSRGKDRHRSSSISHRHSDRSSHDRRHSNSTIYRSKPLGFPSIGSSMPNDRVIDQKNINDLPMEAKPINESYSEYEDNSGDDIESLSKKQIHREMEERLREHLAREGKVYPAPKPQPAFVNDGSFLERFKQMQEQQQKLTEATKPPEPETIPKPTPIPVFGKRRGGKILKTGVVQKKKPVEEPEPTKGTDAWSQYLREVQQYKNVICDADGVTRCLVK